MGIRACQEGENDTAEVVIVFEPEGTSLMMGGLHPRVSDSIETDGLAVESSDKGHLAPRVPARGT